MNQYSINIGKGIGLNNERFAVYKYSAKYELCFTFKNSELCQNQKGNFMTRKKAVSVPKKPASMFTGFR